jgi:hypothetical protein
MTDLQDIENLEEIPLNFFNPIIEINNSRIPIDVEVIRDGNSLFALATNERDIALDSLSDLLNSKLKVYYIFEECCDCKKRIKVYTESEYRMTKSVQLICLDCDLPITRTPISSLSEIIELIDNNCDYSDEDYFQIEEIYSVLIKNHTKNNENCFHCNCKIPSNLNVKECIVDLKIQKLQFCNECINLQLVQEFIQKIELFWKLQKEIADTTTIEF